MDTDKETEKARKEVKAARDEFNGIKKTRCVVLSSFSKSRAAHSPSNSCDLFNKAYNHISDNIDQVYKDLTKGKAAPQGGVAYLSLEDSEVSQLYEWTHQSTLTNRRRRNHITAASSTQQCHQ